MPPFLPQESGNDAHKAPLRVRSCCAECSPEGGLRGCLPAQPLRSSSHRLCFFFSRFEKGDRHEEADLRLDCRHERYPARKWPRPRKPEPILGPLWRKNLRHEPGDPLPDPAFSHKHALQAGVSAEQVSAAAAALTAGVGMLRRPEGDWGARQAGAQQLSPGLGQPSAPRESSTVWDWPGQRGDGDRICLSCGCSWQFRVPPCEGHIDRS